MDIHGSCLSGVGCGPARCVCFARLWCLPAAYELPLNRLLLTDFTSSSILYENRTKSRVLCSLEFQLSTESAESDPLILDHCPIPFSSIPCLLKQSSVSP